jgi:hypothetical protein
MEAKRRCIFCDNVLDDTTMPEHILLNALAGRKDNAWRLWPKLISKELKGLFLLIR